MQCVLYIKVCGKLYMLNVTNSTLKTQAFLQFWMTTDIWPSRLMLFLLLVFTLKVYYQKHSELLVFNYYFQLTVHTVYPCVVLHMFVLSVTDGSYCSHYSYKLHCVHLYILATKKASYIYGFYFLQDQAIKC